MPESNLRARKSVTLFSPPIALLAKRRLVKLKDDLLKIAPAKGKITLAELAVSRSQSELLSSQYAVDCFCNPQPNPVHRTCRLYTFFMN